MKCPAVDLSRRFAIWLTNSLAGITERMPKRDNSGGAVRCAGVAISAVGLDNPGMTLTVSSVFFVGVGVSSFWGTLVDKSRTVLPRQCHSSPSGRRVSFFSSRCPSPPQSVWVVRNPCPRPTMILAVRLAT